MSSSAFPKILHIGDKQILDLFEGEVEITEKLDGSLIKEVRIDIETEEGENIKDALYKIYKEDILKYSVHGVAQWYKEQLIKGEN